MLEKITGFIQAVVERCGTKFLVAVGALIVLWDLACKDKFNIEIGIAVVIVTVVFFVFRYFHDKKEGCCADNQH